MRSRLPYSFKGEDREERKESDQLFPAAKYSYETSESDKWAYVRFPVIDKGETTASCGLRYAKS